MSMLLYLIYCIDVIPTYILTLEVDIQIIHSSYIIKTNITINFINISLKLEVQSIWSDQNDRMISCRKVFMTSLGFPVQLDEVIWTVALHDSNSWRKENIDRIFQKQNSKIIRDPVV